MNTSDLYSTPIPSIFVIGRLSEQAKAIVCRLAAGDPVDDLTGGQDLLRCILSYGESAAPIASRVGPDGITLSDVCLEALRDFPDHTLIAMTGALRSKYARALHAHLSTIGEMGEVLIGFSEMRKILGCGSKLRTSSHLWTRAIVPAVREIRGLGWWVHIVDIRDARARGRVDAYRVMWGPMPDGIEGIEGDH